MTGQTGSGQARLTLGGSINDVHGIGMETPLSGSHLGPHTRPLCPCNKAVFREAVCSSFMPFNAACSCFNCESEPRPSMTNTNTS